MRRTIFGASAAAILAWASIAGAAIIKPTAVTGTIAGDAGSDANFLINDKPSYAPGGLQRPVGTAVTLNTGDPLADALGTFAELSGGGHEESWTRGTGSGNPVFSFDLGADTAIGSIILWQYGNNGGGADRNGNHAREFELIFHTDAEGAAFSFASGGGSEATEFAGTMQRAGVGVLGSTVNNVAQFFGFSGTEVARYVGLRIASNYGGQPGLLAGGDRYGLGEVRFASETVVPEPSTLALAGLALAGIVGRTRRRG